MNRLRIIVNVISLLLLLAILGVSGCYLYENTPLLNSYKYSSNETVLVSEQDIELTLQNFKYSTWDTLLPREKETVSLTLIDQLSNYLGLSHTPEVTFYQEDNTRLLGHFYYVTYEIHINTSTTDSLTLADSIAHEMRHAWQYTRSLNPVTKQDFEFKENFNNYTAYDNNYGQYYDQLVERDAREFADEIIKLLYD